MTNPKFPSGPRGRWTRRPAGVLWKAPREHCSQHGTHSGWHACGTRADMHLRMGASTLRPTLRATHGLVPCGHRTFFLCIFTSGNINSPTLFSFDSFTLNCFRSHILSVPVTSLHFTKDKLLHSPYLILDENRIEASKSSISLHDVSNRKI